MRSKRNRAIKVPAGSALEKLSGIITLPKGKTADDILLEALVEKYGLEKGPREGTSPNRRTSAPSAARERGRM